MRRLLFLSVLLAHVLSASTSAQGIIPGVDIVIDNPQATLIGSWVLASSASTKYGDDYRYCSLSPSNGNCAVYRPWIPDTADDWQVYTWYPSGSNRPTQAQYIIRHSGGTDYVYVNQQVDGGKWVYLGTYRMEAGNDNWVRITNYGSESKVVMADAVRFHSSTAYPDLEPPVISAILASPRNTSAVISWETDEPSTSQVKYGLTASYGSMTTKYTMMTKSHGNALPSLQPNTTYHYRVISVDPYGNTSMSEDSTFTTMSAPPPEFRAAWVDTWEYGFLSSSDITTLINTLHTSNYNAVIPEVRKRGDAYYNASPLFCEACGEYHQEVRASNIVNPPPFDPLADGISKAHAVGMEVHAWIVTYKIWTSNMGNPPSNHLWACHPEWASADSTGNILEGSNYNLDPGIPAVQDYICKVVMDIVGNYDVDGLNFDYIRYTGNNWGYNQITRQRFYNEYGYWPPVTAADPNWDVWCDYRRRQISDLVKKCYLEIMAAKPSVKVSACLISGGGVYPSYNFTQTSTFNNSLQNWPLWAQEKYIDILMPMGYKREHESDQARDYRDWIQLAASLRNGRHSYNGQGAYLNTIDNSMIQMQAVRDHGAGGMVTYSYRSTNSEGRPNSDFYTAVRTGPFQSPASTPPMPWKDNPTTGIIFGTVTNTAVPRDSIYLHWIYGASVTAEGPVTRTTTTDATGTYGFLDLPPGDYTITVSKSGHPVRSLSGKISAGQVLKLDVDLGFTLCETPADAKAMPDDSYVQLAGPIVSAVFPGCFYAQAVDRSGGIRVYMDDHGLSVGTVVGIKGVLTTNSDGERYIAASSVTVGSGGSVEALFMLNRSVGGAAYQWNSEIGEGQRGIKGAAGLNNIGLLISTTGSVTHAEDGFFYIDDGSDLSDGSGHPGVKVLGAVPVGQGEDPVGRYVTVTGASSCFSDGTDLMRLIRATAVQVME